MYKYQLMEIEIMNDDSNGYNKYQEENKMIKTNMMNTKDE